MIMVVTLLFIIAVLVTYLSISIFNSLKTEMNSLQIEYSDPNVAPISFKVAVMGDIHLGEGDDIVKFLKLLEEVKSNSPDLVLLTGDYVKNQNHIKDIKSHRTNVINTFKSLDPIPRAIALGNDEHWTNGNAWLAEFKRLGVDVLENEVRVMDVAGTKVCVRGLGDIGTHKFKYVDYPAEYQSLPKITITHDPQGAFEAGVEGLVFSGHTHCGQVNFPIIGPRMVPTNAPREAICGLYKDSKRTLFVTSGIGWSVLPIRYGTQSQWDLIDLNFE